MYCRRSNTKFKVRLTETRNVFKLHPVSSISFKHYLLLSTLPSAKSRLLFPSDLSFHAPCLKKSSISTAIMAITILAPQPAPTAIYESEISSKHQRHHQPLFDNDSDTEMGGGDDMPHPINLARTSRKPIVTPGENITDDSQWMRLIPPSPKSPSIY